MRLSYLTTSNFDCRSFSDKMLRILEKRAPKRPNSSLKMRLKMASGGFVEKSLSFLCALVIYQTISNLLRRHHKNARQSFEKVAALVSCFRAGFLSSPPISPGTPEIGRAHV